MRFALAALAGETDETVVLVHDAARPLVPVELIEACLAAVTGDGVDAVVAAAPVTDTVKQAGADHRVTATLDRATLWAVQTPQVFRREALEAVLAQDDDVLAAATDDASLVERAGGRVIVVPASTANFKVTTPIDLELAALQLARR